MIAISWITGTGDTVRDTWTDGDSVKRERLTDPSVYYWIVRDKDGRILASVPSLDVLNIDQHATL